MPLAVLNIVPSQLAARLATGNLPQLIDVREEWEWKVARLDTARLIPLADLARASESLTPDDDVVVYCHHGVRSLMAAQFLVNHGLKRVWKVAGGIDRYAADVDPAIPRY